MHIVVMNSDNFIATHPRTVVQYTMKCDTTTKIYNVRKHNTLIHVHYIIFLFWTLNFIVFFTLCFIFFVSRNKYFFETRFVASRDATVF